MATFTVPSNPFRQGLPAPITYTEATPNSGGSPEVTLLNDGSNSRRIFFTRWSDWQQFARWTTGFPVYGSGIVVPGPNASFIARVTPWAAPFIANTAGNEFLYVQGMQRLEGVGPAGNDRGMNEAFLTSGDPSAIYQKARITLGLSTLTYDIAQDGDVLNQAGPLVGYPSDAVVQADKSCVLGRYITRWPKNADRQLTLPNGAMAFVGSGSPGKPDLIPGVGINKKVIASLVCYTWHQVPDQGLPRKAMQRAYGTVNQYPFDGYPKGTLRVDGIDPKPVVSALGDRTWDVQYSLRFEPNYDLQATSNPTPRGHNAFLCNASAARPFNGGTGLNYYYISSNGTDYKSPNNVTNTPGTGVPLYPFFDFANLFRPDQS
jgi:hypothetical protein